MALANNEFKYNKTYPLGNNLMPGRDHHKPNRLEIIKEVSSDNVLHAICDG